jgi:hypothetical protein
VLHGRDVALDLETFYWRAVHALDDDDYEEVRTQALHLVWYPSPFIWSPLPLFVVRCSCC